MTITFTVPGQQRPAGSKRAFPIINKTTGQPLIKNGRIVTRVADDCDKSKDWKAMVAHAAANAINGRPLLTGPLRLEVTFYRMRPKGHYRSGKNSRLLKDSAPSYPTSKPDYGKLARGTDDAMTGIVWCDDAQVVQAVIFKEWAAPGDGYSTVVSVTALVDRAETKGEA